MLRSLDVYSYIRLDVQINLITKVTKSIWSGGVRKAKHPLLQALAFTIIRKADTQKYASRYLGC